MAEEKSRLAALRYGYPCPECGGQVHVYCTRVDFAAQARVRYLRCEACRYKPTGHNVQVIPITRSRDSGAKRK